MKIYTTGAFLRPLKTKGSAGNDLFVWIVSEFNDDSYEDGELCNPNESADSEEALINYGEEGR